MHISCNELIFKSQHKTSRPGLCDYLGTCENFNFDLDIYPLPDWYRERNEATQEHLF